MVVRDIRLLGDPVLTTPSAPVTRFDDRLRRLVDDLLETVDAPGRAGLAAPQIGVGLRVFSYLVDDQHGYVVNPELVELSEATQDGDEGCLSVPDVAAPLRRALRATVRGVDADGGPLVVHGEGLLARCFQHEVDHLDGVLYLDRLEKGDRRRALRDAREQPWFQAAPPRGGLLGR
ncbi:peptide deformylase [Nitriliruptoraceae bacterium ZYF776]|nr:peptide deformylase [Profundirhabdus halotolerans]